MTELAYYPRLVWCLVYSAGGRWSELISVRYSSNYFINVINVHQYSKYLEREPTRRHLSALIAMFINVTIG